MSEASARRGAHESNKNTEKLYKKYIAYDWFGGGIAYKLIIYLRYLHKFILKKLVDISKKSTNNNNNNNINFFLYKLK